MKLQKLLDRYDPEPRYTLAIAVTLILAATWALIIISVASLVNDR